MQFGLEFRGETVTCIRERMVQIYLTARYLMCSQVQKLYLATGNDRLKLLVLYSGEEDERLRKAAAGTLAMLTAEQPELCARIPATVRTPVLVRHSRFQSCIYFFTRVFMLSFHRQPTGSRSYRHCCLVTYLIYVIVELS